MGGGQEKRKKKESIIEDLLLGPGRAGGSWSRVWAPGDGWATSCLQAPQPAPSPAGSRVPSIENVLQDGSPEPCGRSQPGAPADVYLPGKGAAPEARRGRHT